MNFTATQGILEPTMELVAQKRSVTGKGVQALRKEGRLPAVVYSAGEDALPIELSSKDFTRAFNEAGESTVINLMIEGETKNVLIHDVDFDPISNEPRHADFYSVKKGQKVEVSVELEFVGVSPAVKELGANLVKVLHELEVEAEATNLPHNLSVDISGLATLESVILAKDIPLPAGVVLVTDPEETVAIVAMPEEEKEEPVVGPDMAAIGISEERGKKEEEAPVAE